MRVLFVAEITTRRRFLRLRDNFSAILSKINPSSCATYIRIKQLAEYQHRTKRPAEMQVFFNAKKFYRRMLIRLQKSLAFLYNSFSLLLRKVEYDIGKNKPQKTRRNASLF